MFMAAYEDVEMLSRLREDTDNNVRAIGGAMIEAAPAWVGMREAAKAGTIDPDVDVTPQLVEAVNLVRKSRNEGTPLAMLVGQTEMFIGEAIDPLTEAVLGVMYRDPGTWKKPLGRERVVTALKSVVDQANKTVVGEDLLGETTDVPGVLGAARRAALEGLADADAQADIFKSEKPADDGARTESAGEGRAGPDPGEAAARDGEEGAPSGEQGSEARVDQTRALATEVANRIARGEKLDNPALFALADEAFGGTVGDGTYDPQDAYNATELAINGMIAEADLRNLTPETAARFAEDMLAATAALPTQTRRTGEKIKFQQFSTPPAYAMAAAYTAAVKEGDRVLEPSAGVGGIAVAARSMGGDVTVNEISEKRAEGLRILGFDPTTEDAEQIANIMEPESFDVVVMNPPFSAAGKRGVKNSNTIGARHVSQAAKMLKPGGRLVTIMGEGFTPENARVRGLFSQMQKEGQFQAIVKMDGSKLYRKYGTTFDNQFIVWDKTGAPGDPTAIMRGEFDNIPNFIRAMEDIRNARPVAGDGVGAAIPPPGDLGTELPGDLGVSGEGAVAGVAQGPSDLGLRDQPVDRRPDQPGVREGVGPGGVGTGVETAGLQERSGREAGGTGRRGGEQQRTQRVEQVAVAEQRIKEEEGTAFSAYQPSRVKVKGAQAHPAKLVESTAMASVKPPPTDYTPVIAQETVSEGRLSDAQLEQITFAGNAHAKKLPDDRRRGYFIGDGTGVGKGREIAGIMLDNWSQGRKRHVWVSKDKKLLKDAQRDVLGVGIEAELHDLTSTAKAQKMAAPEGIAFTTYSTLRSPGTAEQKRDKEKFPNVQKLANWLGEDFDGVIAFDEAHVMANVMGSAGSRGQTGPSQVAQAGQYLAELLPNARVVYVSATGATEVNNLGYLDRLGLWGEGTAFSDVRDFTTKIGAGGVATMELVARDMKQMGMYGARSISFHGVEYDNVTHSLSGEQREMYDVAARAWQTVFNNIDAVMEDLMPGTTKAEQGKAKPMSYFWGANQRFFNQVLSSLQMPSVINAMERDKQVFLGISAVFGFG